MIFSPLFSKLRRLRQPHIRASDVAVKKWIVSPAEDVVSPAAIYFRDELTRITGYAAHSHQAQEMSRLVPHTITRRPTIASQLDNAVICGGNLYAGAFKYPMRDTRRLLASISREIADGGVPCSSWLGGLYFGHWITEDTPLKLLAEPIGMPTELDSSQTRHQVSYNELFGIQRTLLPDDCLVKKTVLIETDLFSSFLSSGWNRMTAAIEAQYPPTPHIGCMLLRGSSGSKRLLVNEAEVAERLASCGFRIIDPSTSSLPDILAAASGSRIVVGVEGSQLAHGFHCLSAGGAMVTLQPPDRFGCIDKYRCDLKQARYAFSLGHAEGEGFRIHIDSLMRIIDRVVDELRPVSAAGLD